MASPFAVFRRNQRVMMAVLGVVVILLFVVGDPLSRIIGGQSSPVNPLVVKTNYGNYRRSELDGINYQRRLLGIFLERVVAAHMRLEGTKAKMPEDQLRMYTKQAYARVHATLMGRDHPPGDAATIETIVLARRAEELGMVASDRAVNELLEQIAGSAYSQLPAIIASLKTDGRVPISQTYLFDALQREILASKYSLMFQVGLWGIAPGERWNYFQQLNRKADAQVLPVKVLPLVQKVADPTPEELERYFERYKNVLPDPNSPEPGFKEPLRIAFAYFKANVDQAAEKAATEVTSEEMHDYYEKNKVQFREGRLPPMTDLPTDNKSSTEDPLGPDEPAGEMPAEPATENQPPASENAPPAAPADTPSEPAAPKAGEAPAAAPTKPAAPAAKPAAPAKPAPGAPPAKKSSQLEPRRGDSRFRLASGGQKPAPTKPAPGKPAAPAKPATGNPATAKPATPAAQQPAADQPPTSAKPAASDPLADPDTTTTDTAKPEADAAKSDGDTTSGTPDAAEGTLPAGSEEKKEEIKYEPYEKAEDTIRKTLALQKAQEQVRTAFERLQSKVRAYGTARRAYLTNRQDDPQAKPPEELDLKALADEYGVTAHTIEPAAAYEAAAEELGKSYNFAYDPFRQLNFLQMAYLDPHEFRPIESTDDEHNRFLWWETSISPENVPTLDAVRDEVVRKFKLKEARELALKQAEAYAKQVREAKKPLAEVFKGREGLEVTETGPFTRLTMGNTPYDPDMSQPRLSPVHGVEVAGTAFMDAVFNASPGDVQVALNQPETIAYVVQLVEFMPEVRTLEHEFLLEPFQKYSAVANADQRYLYGTWLNTLENEAGVQWLETPQVDSRAEE